MLQRRRAWDEAQPGLDPDRLVFVDETWIKTNMTLLRGWAQRDRRLKGYAPHAHWRIMAATAVTGSRHC